MLDCVAETWFLLGRRSVFLRQNALVAWMILDLEFWALQIASIDMIWAEFLKKVKIGRIQPSATIISHNQTKITVTLNLQKKHVCIDCIVAEVL